MLGQGVANMWVVRFVIGTGSARASVTEKRFETKREAHAAINVFNNFKNICRIGHLYIITKSVSKY